MSSFGPSNPSSRARFAGPPRTVSPRSWAGTNSVNGFYAVFTSNMRDLGSPVHSKGFIARVASLFSRDALFCLVKKDGRTPAAASLLLRFRDVVHNPWASSLRRFTRSSPNMLLYWKMLESACDDGCRIFDFGRSSVDGGTFRFKKQWGAQPRTLSWCRLTLDGHPDSNQQPEGQGLSWAHRLFGKDSPPV